MQQGCKQALMKAKSPSCGYKRIYDGTFSKTLREGHGCTVEALLMNNIEVYTEEDIDLLMEQKRVIGQKVCVTNPNKLENL